MDKRARVFMLSTNEKATSCIMLGVVPNHCALTKDVINDTYDWMKFGKPQHLYITSDDEIKEGDWVLSGTNTIIQCMYPDNVHHRDIKKIIATTDTSLTIPYWSKVNINILYKSLPQPSQSFIQKYVDEYKKGNKIVYVLVEYEKHFDEDWSDISGAFEIEYETLKVNSKDNTITIRRVKDSWSRDEVVELIKTFRNSIIPVRDEEIKFTNKWIEENL